MMIKLLSPLLLLATLISPVLAQPDITPPEPAKPGVLAGHPGIIGSIQFSPNGKYLAAIVREEWWRERTETAKSQVSLWEVATGRLLWSRESAINDGPPPLFSPDSKTVLCYGKQVSPKGDWGEGVAAQFNAWEVTSGKPLYELEMGKREMLLNLFFSPDGKWLLGNTDNFENAGRLTGQPRHAVKMWDSATGKFERIPSTQPDLVRTRQWAASPGYLATPTTQSPQDQRKNKVDVWSLADYSLHRSLSLGQEENVQLCAISPDGTKVALQTFLPGANDQQIYLWDLTTQANSPVVIPEAISFHVTSLEFSPDSHLLLGSGRILYKTGIGGTALWAWNAQTGILEATVEADMKTRQRAGQLPMARFSPDGNFFAVFRIKDRIELRNAQDGELVRLFEAGA
jgi:WD40 repeat protein